MRRAWAERAALAAVMLLAAWWRFGYVGVNSFAFDEARLSLIALRMARGGEFAAVGMPSSAGVPNMPAAAWLFALPYALSSSPQVATWFVSAASLAAVFGVWWLARRWGVLAGTVAAGFVAVNPFAVLYGRSVWAQNLLIPLAVAWLVAVVTAADAETSPGRRRWAVGAAAFLTGFTVQVHFAGAALVLAGAYALIRWRWWRYPAAVLAGGGLAVICALPFILTPGAVMGVLSAAGGDSQWSVTAWTETVRLIAGYDWAYLLHGEAELPLTPLGVNSVRIGAGVFVAVLLGLMGLFGAAAVLGVDGDADDLLPDVGELEPRIAPAHLVEAALVVLLTPALFFTRHSNPVFIHYLLPALPAAALLLGWLAADARPRAARVTVSVLVGVLALGWVGQLGRAFPYAAETLTPNGMATPLGVLQRAAEAPDAARQVLYFTHGDDPNTQGEPAIFSALWWERPARILDGRSVLVLPDEPAALMFTERAFQAWEELRQSELGGQMEAVPRREGAPDFQVTGYDGSTRPAGFTMLDAPVTFAHGGTLLGWRTYQVGPRTRISTLWRADGPIGETVQQFHHLRTGAALDGGEPSAVSDVSVRGHTWRAGDTVIVMADFFDVQPGTEYTLEVGHYTLPDVVRIPHDAGEVVRLGTFSVMP